MGAWTTKRSAGGAFRTLWEWEKPEYIAHLLRLDRESRRQRFHRAMTDRHIADHADRAFADPNLHIIGWFKNGVLRGACEVAIYDTARGREAEAAFAIEAEHRMCGVGRALMERAALHARNLGATDLHITTDQDNRAMIGLARSCGAEVTIRDMEAEGVLHAKPRTVISVALETIEEDLGVAQWAWDSLRGWLSRRMRRLSGVTAFW